MRLLWRKLNKVGISLIIVTFLSFMVGAASYSDTEDKADQLSGDSSKVLGAGYMNVDMQKTTRYIREVKPEKKSLLEKTMEFIRKKLGARLAEDTTEGVEPDLQRKKASGATTTTETTSSIDSLNYDVDIGSGTDQLYGQTGYGASHLLYETINGVRHIYAGFDDYGTGGSTAIQDAIDLASAGDIIIVKGGQTYSEQVTVTAGVKLYGGYKETGERDVSGTASTILAGGVTPGTILLTNLAATTENPTEINGFTIGGYDDSGIGINATNCSNLIIANTTFTDPGDFDSGCMTITGSSGVELLSNTVSEVTVDTAVLIDNTTANVYGLDVTGSSDTAVWLQNNSVVSYSGVSVETGTQNIVTVGSFAKDADESAKTSITTTTTSELTDPFSDDYFRNISYYKYGKDYDIGPGATTAITITLGGTSTASVSGEEAIEAFNKMLAREESGSEYMKGEGLIVAEPVAEEVEGAALVPITGEISPEYMEIMALLKGILRGEEYKPLMEAWKAAEEAINEVREGEGTEGATVASDEALRAWNEFAQMFLITLMAQETTTPELKEGMLSVEAVKASLERLREEAEATAVTLSASKQDVTTFEINFEEYLRRNVSILPAQAQYLLSAKKKLEPEGIDEILEVIERWEVTTDEERAAEKSILDKATQLEDAKRDEEEAWIRLDSAIREATQDMLRILEDTGAIEGIEKKEDGTTEISVDLSRER